MFAADDPTEAAILEALRVNEVRWLGREPVGLMTKEVAEHAKVTLEKAQRTLSDMAERGLVHRSMFFWFSGSDPHVHDEQGGR